MLVSLSFLLPPPLPPRRNRPVTFSLTPPIPDPGPPGAENEPGRRFAFGYALCPGDGGHETRAGAAFDVIVQAAGRTLDLIEQRRHSPGAERAGQFADSALEPVHRPAAVLRFFSCHAVTSWPGRPASECSGDAAARAPRSRPPVRRLQRLHRPVPRPAPRPRTRRRARHTRPARRWPGPSRGGPGRCSAPR